MEKTRKWRKILAMMLTVVMMLQNAQSVMVFADVTNEQIEQRLAGNQGQTEETQPAQSQVDTRANGEEYKTQSQETQENGNGSTDIGSPESGNATTGQRLPMQMYLQPLPRACSRQMSVEPPVTSCR